MLVCTTLWGAWLDLWELRHYQARLLQASYGRLSKPLLASCVAHWRREWEVAEIKRQMEMKAAVQKHQTKPQQQVVIRAPTPPPIKDFSMEPGGAESAARAASDAVKLAQEEAEAAAAAAAEVQEQLRRRGR